MSRILFMDWQCTRTYDPELLRTVPLGGTEATVVRVAQGLAARGHDVVVAQHCRQTTAHAGATYSAPLESLLHERWDVIVILRNAHLLAPLRERYPATPILFWLHDLAGESLSFPAVSTAEPLVITVSDFHRRNVEATLASLAPRPSPKVVRVYNPIDDDLAPDGTAFDRNKLVFFSSPHKGLERTLQLFEQAVHRHVDLRLFVANPGYFSLSIDTNGRDVLCYLGSLTHREVITHVRQSLCVFYMNKVFPETFGLVLAEANAVGTPVLTHDLGAAAEVLGSAEQLVDTDDTDAVIARLMRWHGGGRPAVHANPQFRLPNVIDAWERVLATVL